MKYTSKPRNFVAKNTQTSGAGAHTDKKKAAIKDPRKAKHKKNLDTLDAIKENFDAEYDDEAGMSHNSLHTMMRAVEGLEKIINNGDNLPEWCQEKLSIAEDYLVTVWDYLQSEHGVTEGKGDFDKAINNLHGWYEVDSPNPNIKMYDFDDREGGFYAQGTVEHNLKTGQVRIKFEDGSGQYGDDVNQTFNSIGDAMNVLRTITTQYTYNNGKAQNYNRLGGRDVAGSNDLYKTDRAGKKGTLTKSRMDTMKAASPGRITGPKGRLPKESVAEFSNLKQQAAKAIAMKKNHKKPKGVSESWYNLRLATLLESELKK